MGNSTNMETPNSTVASNCIPVAVGMLTFTLNGLPLPFHFLMIKVLLFDLRLNLPRHSIMLCLSIADTLQIFIPLSCVTVMMIFSLAKDSSGCYIAKGVTLFTIALTLVVSSLSILTLSVERYVACVHSFRLHQVFTREKIIYGASGIWVLGITCGIMSAKNRLGLTQNQNQFMKIVAVIFIIPTSVIITVVQFRLFRFSRKKLARVKRKPIFGSEAEIADLRKRQIKVAFVASIVAIAYIFCMLPMAVLSLYELIFTDVPTSTTTVIVKGLAILNNLADPYIYGIGISDTRQALVKNLKKLKNWPKRNTINC